jgi:hypothetical protein
MNIKFVCTHCYCRELILKFNSISEIAVHISKVLPRRLRRVLFYLQRRSALQLGVYLYGMGVKVFN